jgi:alpha-N-arabinofuranosidase
MFRYSNVFTMSAFTGLTSTVAYDRSEAWPTMRAVGQVFRLYTEHFGTLPLPVTGDSPQPELRGTIGVDKASVSSGSPTYPLDVMATLSADRRTVTVAVTNPSETAMTLRLAFQGGTPASNGKVWTIAAREFGGRAVAGQAPVATTTESPVADPAAPLTIPPVTIKLYEFKLQ